MDLKGMEETETKSRSFRYEDYNNRRAFLRSYPLYTGAGEDEDTTELENAKNAKIESSSKKKHMMKIILAGFHWGGERAVILRRFKHKVTVYVITCLPGGLKAPTALISV